MTQRYGPAYLERCHRDMLERVPSLRCCRLCARNLVREAKCLYSLHIRDELQLLAVVNLAVPGCSGCRLLSLCPLVKSRGQFVAVEDETNIVYGTRHVSRVAS